MHPNHEGTTRTASIFRVGDRWCARIRRKGHKTLSENFATKQDAQRWARQHEHQMDKGKRAAVGLHLTTGEVIAKDLDGVNGLKGTKKRILEKHEVTFVNVRIDECGKPTIFNDVAQRELEGLGRPRSRMTCRSCARHSCTVVGCLRPMKR